MSAVYSALTGVNMKSLIMLSRTFIGLVGTSHLKEHINLSILAVSDFRYLLYVLDQSLNLCYRFTLLNENNANKSESPPSLNIAFGVYQEPLF